VEAFERAVAKFTGLPHRTQFIGEWNQISVFNDSKSTTVASTTAALSTVLAENPDSNVTLLVGGLVKKGSWQPLFELIKEVRDNRIKPRVIRLICFGKDGPTIHDLANKEGIENLLCGGVRDAISLLPDSTNRDLSVRKREVVLFSPGGASFDEFKDFEQRGDFFTKLVREYFSREE
jgi:UDP-N-acetylmuramoylalanine--D-glutamate ligase